MQERSSPIVGQLAGSLLLAHPSLRDENFRRSVILMSAHDANGAMGIVLNRPTGKKLGELTADFALGPLASIPIFNGGPVQTEQLLLCGWKLHEDGSGFQLMFGMDPAKAGELLNEPRAQVRAFFGYSGWTGGQLENEVERQTWVVSPLVSGVLDGDQDETLWKSILGNMSLEWKLLTGEPEDLELN
jgi:putative transcriptional regulator